MMSSPGIAPHSARAQDPWGGENMINGNDGMPPGLLSVAAAAQPANSLRLSTPGHASASYRGWADLHSEQRGEGLAPPVSDVSDSTTMPEVRPTLSIIGLHHHMRAAAPRMDAGVFLNPGPPQPPLPAPRAPLGLVGITHHPTGGPNPLPNSIRSPIAQRPPHRLRWSCLIEWRGNFTL
jgi:hypothetical protein